MQEFKIHQTSIGPGHPTYVIAELSANHNQQFDRAAQLVQAAGRAGVDAVKLQTYTADTITIDCEQPPFQIDQGTAWDGQTLHNLYRQAYTPWEWQPKLKRLANSLGMDCFSSPFDKSAVEFLVDMNVPAMKIASFELVDLGLLECVAKTGLPVIMSTGMASEQEISRAVRTLRQFGCSQIALLKCTSAYPAPETSMNLRTIPELSRQYQVPGGLSDHSLGNEAAIAAVALGANIVEKHLTLSRSDGGPDSCFSLEPDEFQQLVTSIRKTESALGTVHFGTTEFDERNRAFRRSLFVVKDVQAGDLLTNDNIRSIRPADGLEPRFLKEVLGKTAACDISRGSPLAWNHIEGQGKEVDRDDSTPETKPLLVDSVSKD